MKSIPLHLLVESQDHVVTVELSNGETYRGKLEWSEDNMNLRMADVIATSREGVSSKKGSVFVRGSHVKLVRLPELLRYAPVLRPDLATKSQEEANLRKNKRTARSGGSKPPRKHQKTEKS